MASITVGFDGTDASRVALEWAASMAAQRGLHVDIVCINLPELFPDQASIAMDLQDAELFVRNRAPDSTVTSRIVAGRMPEALLEAGALADLVVIGAHRHRPMRTALTGWLPMQIASGSTVPTVVVPDDWSESDGPVVVGIDDDVSSERAVEFASNEAAASQVLLTLLHAWQTHVPPIEGHAALLAPTVEVKTAHRRILQRVYQHVIDSHPDLRVDRILAHSDPASALLAARASLLVLGTHHRTPLSAAVLGSVGKAALSGSRIPVCVVPEAGNTP